MKYLVIVFLIYITPIQFCSAQNTKSARYFNYSFSHGCFTVIYTNTTFFQIVNTGTSQAPFGTFTLCCVQHYLLLIKKFYDYGQLTAHLPIRGFTRIEDTDVPGITIVLQNSHPYILIVDNNGAVWQLTKAQAFALVPILQEQTLVTQMTACPDPNCICTEQR